MALAGRAGSGNGPAEVEPEDAAEAEGRAELLADPLAVGVFLPCAWLDADHHADASNGANSATARTIERARTGAGRADVMGGLHQVFGLRASAAE
jgi:hypothetical protein